MNIHDQFIYIPIFVNSTFDLTLGVFLAIFENGLETELTLPSKHFLMTPLGLSFHLVIQEKFVKILAKSQVETRKIELTCVYFYLAFRLFLKK